MNKLNFDIDIYDGFLQAALIGVSGVNVGFCRIWQNKNLFIVEAYIANNQQLFNINDGCDNIYQALDSANDWWDKFKKNSIIYWSDKALNCELFDEPKPF